MLVNDFFVRTIDEMDDKVILLVSRVLFYNINKLKDRDKFLKNVGISQAEYLKFLEALGRPYDLPFLREFLKKIVATAIDKVSKENATEEKT